MLLEYKTFKNWSFLYHAGRVVKCNGGVCGWPVSLGEHGAEGGQERGRAGKEKRGYERS
jgi:hypothetical protein